MEKSSGTIMRGLVDNAGPARRFESPSLDAPRDAGSVCLETLCAVSTELCLSLTHHGSFRSPRGACRAALII